MSLVWLTTTPAVTAASKAAWTFILSSSAQGDNGAVWWEILSRQSLQRNFTPHISIGLDRQTPVTAAFALVVCGLPMLASDEAPYFIMPLIREENDAMAKYCLHTTNIVVPGLAVEPEDIRHLCCRSNLSPVATASRAAGLVAFRGGVSMDPGQASINAQTSGPTGVGT